jgi:hypothetical protein
VLALAGVTVSVPASARAPVQPSPLVPPLPVHAVALLDDQFSIVDCPTVIDAGVALNVTLGTVTVKVAFAVAV